MELLCKAVTYRKTNNSLTSIPISLIIGEFNFQIKANNDQIWPYETQNDHFNLFTTVPMLSKC